MLTWALPEKLANLVESHLEACQNLGLILDKYQPWKYSQREQGPELRFRIQVKKRGNWQPKIAKGNEAKGYWLSCGTERAGVKLIDKIVEPNQKIDRTLYQKYLARWKDSLNQIGGISFPMRNISRITLGLGSKGTLEMGITLHHHGGFPMIAGSALKGVARTRALYRLAEVWGIPAADNTEIQPRQKTALQRLEQLLETAIAPDDDPHRLDELEKNLRRLKEHPSVQQARGQILNTDATTLANDEAFLRFRQIFGSQNQSGEIIFFGGMCETVPVLVTEIMTPHYQQYYKDKDKDFPRDDDSPEPNVYLTLETGQVFWFGLAPRKPSTSHNLLEAAEKYLMMGLQELGLGAKTSSGMGLFETILRR